jgi:hypothetical protein
MVILYKKEILYKPEDKTMLSFDAFTALIEEYIELEYVRYTPKFFVRNQIALYSEKEKDSITLLTIHATSENDITNIDKTMSAILARKKDYDYYIMITQKLVKGTGEDTGMIYPVIYLEGRDKDEKQLINRTYEITFEKPGGKITGLKKINLSP